MKKCLYNTIILFYNSYCGEIKMTSELMLGDTDIGSYIREVQPQKNELESNGIGDRVKSLEGFMKNALPAEKLLLREEHKKLYHELISREYAPIDVSFLGTSSTLKLNRKKLPINYEIKVPRFSVYPFYGNNTFSTEIRAYWLESGVDIRMDPKLPRVIIESLLKSFEFSDSPISEPEIIRLYDISKDKAYKKVEYSFNKVPRLIRYNYHGRHILKNQFSGLIPEETKRSVKEATKYFPENQIMLVAETKLENWNVELRHLPITKDPIVIGISKYGGCFLIDHFDTTPLEDLVKDQFLKNNLN